MRCCLWIILTIVLSGEIRTSRADEPRALLERALKARGGVELVHTRVAIRMNVRGKIYTAAGAIRIQGEMWEFGPRGRLRFQLEGDLKGQCVIVTDGDNSWRDINGQIENFDKDDLASLQISEYVDRVTELADLLTGKQYSFAPIADIEVEGRPAQGIKVSSRDRPDVHLYFDKATGFLVKYRYRAPKVGQEKEVVHETVLSDYREPDLAAADEKILREAKVGVDGAALLAFLRARTPSPANLERVRALIPKLGDEAFAVREQASRDLIGLGTIAIPSLREATKNEDREIVRRARECLQAIGEDRSKIQTAAALRLLGLRKPAGTTEVLLNYLPSADGELAMELQAVLYAIAQTKGEADPVLVRALDDKNLLRRRVAAAVLGKDGGVYARQPGRRLYSAMPKSPRKHRSWLDGNLDMEMESFDYQFFNAFEDKVFAKP